MRDLLDAILRFQAGRLEFKEILHDEEKRAKTIKYGAAAIVTFLFVAALGVFALLGIKALDGNPLHVFYLLMFVIQIVLIIFAVVIPPIGALIAFINAVRQCRLKRKAGGIIALILIIGGLIAYAAFAEATLSSLKFYS